MVQIHFFMAYIFPWIIKSYGPMKKKKIFHGHENAMNLSPEQVWIFNGIFMAIKNTINLSLQFMVQIHGATGFQGHENFMHLNSCNHSPQTTCTAF